VKAHQEPSETGEVMPSLQAVTKLGSHFTTVTPHSTEIPASTINGKSSHCSNKERKLSILQKISMLRLNIPEN
jgi:hypothetical protein